MSLASIIAKIPGTTDGTSGGIRTITFPAGTHTIDARDGIYTAGGAMEISAPTTIRGSGKSTTTLKVIGTVVPGVQSVILFSVLMTIPCTIEDLALEAPDDIGTDENGTCYGIYCQGGKTQLTLNRVLMSKWNCCIKGDAHVAAGGPGTLILVNDTDLKSKGCQVHTVDGVDASATEFVANRTTFEVQQPSLINNQFPGGPKSVQHNLYLSRGTANRCTECTFIATSLEIGCAFMHYDGGAGINARFCEAIDCTWQEGVGHAILPAPRCKALIKGGTIRSFESGVALYGDEDVTLQGVTFRMRQGYSIHDSLSAAGVDSILTAEDCDFGPQGGAYPNGPEYYVARSRSSSPTDPKPWTFKRCTFGNVQNTGAAVRLQNGSMEFQETSFSTENTSLYVFRHDGGRLILKAVRRRK